MTDIAIRAERPSDSDRVYEVQKAAFGQLGEAELVNRLRASAEPQLSLVAEQDDAVVGHVFFSPVTIDGSGTSPTVCGLGPLAVAPEAQRLGAGSALVRAGLDACPALGWGAVFLLGDPAYYSRFGFHLAAPLGLHYESEVFDSGFQVKELLEGTLTGCSGWVRYHKGFAGL